jgi:hypothetical protein
VRGAWILVAKLFAWRGIQNGKELSASECRGAFLSRRRSPRTTGEGRASAGQERCER